MRTVLRAAVAGLVVVWMSSPVAAQSAQRGVNERDVFEVQPAGSKVTRVEVDNRLGSVRIEGHDASTVTISAFKRARDAETVDRLKVRLVPDPNGPVRIYTAIAPGKSARPIPTGSVRIDLVLGAPRAAEIVARVWNGKLEVIGMDNGAELLTNDGDIAVSNVSGTVTTHSAAGRQRFVDIFGIVDAQAIAGDMDLEVVSGQRLSASAHDGNIAGRRVRVREVSIRTTRGNIRFQGFALAGGRYRVRSYSGNVAVEFGHAAPLSVSARSRRGRVTLPASLAARTDEQGAFVGVLPGDDSGATAVVELRSRVGTIRFAVVR